MIRALLLVSSLVSLLGSCAAYEPAGLDRTKPSYQADLDECQVNEPVAVDEYNAKIGARWFVSPFRRPFQVREAIRCCMVKKGYKSAG